MIILVEGQDGAGKSTLVERLIARHRQSDPAGHVRHLRAGRPTAATLLAEYLTPLLGLDYRGGDVVVCDRWFLGELVYPALTGRASLADPLELRYLVAWLRAAGALLVHVTAPEAVVRDRILRRDPADPDADPVLVSQQAKLFAAAVAEVRALGLTTLTVDTATEPDDGYRGGHDRVVTTLANRLWFESTEVLTPAGAYQTADGTGHPAALGPTGRAPRYVGSTRPELLLLGDEQGPAYPELTVPFVPLRRGCGAYLWQALTDTEPAARPHRARYRALEGRVGALGLRDLGVVNAHDPGLDSPADLRRLWRRLGEPPVAVLGARALATARRAALPASQLTPLPHPQWVRRFHHAQLTAYGAAVWSAAGAHRGEDLRETWPTCTP